MIGIPRTIPRCGDSLEGLMELSMQFSQLTQISAHRKHRQIMGEDNKGRVWVQASWCSLPHMRGHRVDCSPSSKNCSNMHAGKPVWDCDQCFYWSCRIPLPSTLQNFRLSEVYPKLHCAQSRHSEPSFLSVSCWLGTPESQIPRFHTETGSGPDLASRLCIAVPWSKQFN